MLKEILLSETPSIEVIKNKDYIFKLIPELKDCEGFLQYNDYHCYDVFGHILKVMDNVDKDYILRIAALFHDIGKPLSFKRDENGVGHFLGHYNESLRIFKKYAKLFDISKDDEQLICDLIFYHDLSNDHMDTFKEIFKDKLDYLYKIKKADIKAQSLKYMYRLDEIDKIWK